MLSGQLFCCILDKHVHKIQENIPYFENLACTALKVRVLKHRQKYFFYLRATVYGY